MAPIRVLSMLPTLRCSVDQPVAKWRTSDDELVTAPPAVPRPRARSLTPYALEIPRAERAAGAGLASARAGPSAPPPAPFAPPAARPPPPGRLARKSGALLGG